MPQQRPRLVKPGSTPKTGKKQTQNLSAESSCNFAKENSGILLGLEDDTEVDGDFEDDAPLDDDCEAEHGLAEIDEEADGDSVSDQCAHSTPATKLSQASEEKKKRYVIPKLKQKGDNDSGDDGKHALQRNARAVKGKEHEAIRTGSAGNAKRKHSQDDTDRDSQNRDQPQKKMPKGRQSLFESFTEQNSISVKEEEDEEPEKEEVDEGAADFHDSEEEEADLEGEQDEESEDEERVLGIPLGRDNLVFARDYYPWQIRLYPVSKADMARADFAQVWAVADSSSISWSDRKDFAGVAEFLLKNLGCIQKFMRKILWHKFESDVITVEVIERGQAGKDNSGPQGEDLSLLDISNQAVFKFDNTRARQLIKTYYPTPKGEVTERSVYVDNISSDQSTSLLKALFPCAAKINLTKSDEESSAAEIETESADEAFNYLIVYHEVKINNQKVALRTTKMSSEEAKKKYFSQQKTEKKQDSKVIGSSKEPLLRTPGRKTSKNPPGTIISARGLAKKVKPKRRKRTLLPNPVRGGMDGLLPIPGPANHIMGGGDGLLPLPPREHPPSLLAIPSVPTVQGLLEGDRMIASDPDPRAIELEEIRHHLESKVMETRAQLQSHLNQLDHAIKTGVPSRPLRSDYLVEEPPRRTLLPLDSHHRVEREEDWREEMSADYLPPRRKVARHEIPVERDYVKPRAYGRDRRDEEYDDIRSARPYLLEVPEAASVREEQDARAMYDYDRPYRSSQAELTSRQERQSLRGRGALLERERLAYPEEQLSRSRAAYDYEGRAARRPVVYEDMEKESRRKESRRSQSSIRYRDDYDRRY